MINIKKFRKRKKMSQKELAKNLSVNQTVVSQWEREIVNPRADKLPEIAKILGCTIDDLFKDE